MDRGESAVRVGGACRTVRGVERDEVSMSNNTILILLAVGVVLYVVLRTPGATVSAASTPTLPTHGTDVPKNPLPFNSNAVIGMRQSVEPLVGTPYQLQHTEYLV